MVGSYDFTFVGVSILIAMISALVSLDLMSRMQQSKGFTRTFWLISGSVALGIGIWSMHFIGMLAYELPFPVYYRADSTFLSLLLAIGSSFLAFYTINRPGVTKKNIYFNSFWIGVGILSMHYVGMKAARFLPASQMEKVLETVLIGGDYIELYVIIGTTIIFLLSFISILIDREISSRVIKIGELRYRSLFKHNTDAIYTFDEKGSLLAANPAGEQLLGYTKEELLQLTFTPLIKEEDLERTTRYFEQTLLGQAVQYEITCIHKDGQKKELSVKNIPFVVDGKVVGVFAIARDMTEKIAKQKMLRESEERYRQILEHAPYGIIIQKDGIILYANMVASNIILKDDPIGKTIWSFMSPEEQQRSQERIKEIQGRKNIPTYGLELIRSNGEVIDAESNSTLIPLGEGSAILTFFKDITMEKKTEEALKRSEENYRLVTMHSQDLIKIVDRQGNVLFASPSHYIVLGYRPEELVEKPFSRNIHPDDLALYDKFIESVKEGEAHSFEFRRQHKNGDWVWIESLVTPIQNDEGITEKVVITSRDISLKKYYQSQLEHLAFHDELTGLPNRRLYQQIIEKSIKEAIRYNRSLAVMYMDLDKFKHINDTYGHDVGDELLKQFAERLKKCVRESDTVARLGGDEFNVLLPDFKQGDGAIRVAEKIMEALRKPWKIKEHEFEMTSSIGIAYFPKDGDNAEQLIKHADMALYQAKQQGRNNVQCYDHGCGR